MMAIFRPANRKGIEAGSRTSQKVRHVEAVRPRHSRTREWSVESRPATMAMKIGKKQMKVAMASRDCQPMPTQTMNSGVQAIFGTSWMTMIRG